MNRTYRLAWNDINRTWVAVAEIVKVRGKRGSGPAGHAPARRCAARCGARRLLAAALALVGAPVWALDVNALPSGGKVTAGSASIGQSGSALTIQQASQRAALDWQSFNIGAAASVNFIQPSSSAVALNRILGNEASQIYGKLNANGQVFLSNPNGMLFARGAQVNVGGLLATTMKITNEDFMAGNYRFTQSDNGAGSGSIRNQGIIRALGSVALIGSKLSNEGQIIATTVSLAAGNTVAVDLTGDGLIRARVQDPALQASIENSGSIDSISAVMLSAGQARGTLDRVVNNSGVIRATGLSIQGGEILLEGGQTLNSGVLDASSGTGQGGGVKLIGTQVAMTGRGSIDVSGDRGGGTVLIGGGFQGRNPEVANAEATYLGADTVIKADATKVGAGGTAIVWADGSTRAYGSISARGGAQGGDGGFIETSGKQYLEVTRAADASAVSGKAGTWLLDPNNITIQASGSDTNVGGGPNYVSTNDSSIVTTGSIQTALNAGTSVTIATSSGGTNAQAGDITVASAISKTAGADATLTLNAHNNINLNASITSTIGQLSMVFNPDLDNSGAGAVVLGTTTLNANGGTISAVGKTVNLSSGTATINSAMDIGTALISNGTLSGAGALTVDALNWTGGTINRTGTTTVGAGGLSIAGATQKNLYGS
ncbi:MAG: filamentous hemagglutinin N-terminal domain-containing protein, partial [Sulfuritalea sp.]|nr:filamentous hemagglutinin N-terminal domain-containing protein [Sulfuritalea sp.]